MLGPEWPIWSVPAVRLLATFVRSTVPEPVVVVPTPTLKVPTSAVKPPRPDRSRIAEL